MKIDYARVSTDDQSLALQVDALVAAGCKQICRDEGVSGARMSRPALDMLLATARSGDVVVAWRLDRLDRSLSHLIDLISVLRERGVGFVSLCEADRYRYGKRSIAVSRHGRVGGIRTRPY
ncbi:protein of unknown function [Hyphomicrobium sp. 1Nfss2.1]|uniref:recombinase family protein n=1 Tax=Hyphomicrobium sp. 1Nfss2.1 TaxID=3413936 RepID=UPI003C7BCAB6